MGLVYLCDFCSLKFPSYYARNEHVGIDHADKLQAERAAAEKATAVEFLSETIVTETTAPQSVKSYFLSGVAHVVLEEGFQLQPTGSNWVILVKNGRIYGTIFLWQNTKRHRDYVATGRPV